MKGTVIGQKPITAKLHPEKSKKNPFEKKLNYLNATKEDLLERNVAGWRISIAEFMFSKPVDIFIVALTILYTLLVIVYLAIDDLINDSHTTELT